MDWFNTSEARKYRAVAYYRHSAQDRQENSVEIQQDQVRQFALEHDIEIIREFSDRGKSGLSTEGRDAFNEMIQDYVEGAKETFDFVLVLDVSRWGRYQDTDLSAYFTGLCAKHGKQVVFTTIGFGEKNDLLHGLHLSIERYRAASYSRELSSKVFKGCAKIASQGFRAGGMPPYAFHRLLLDEQRHPVQVLDPGQRKSIQNQRVTLTPGQPEQIAIVKRIFRAFVHNKKSTRQIAGMLNGDGIPSPGNGTWSFQAVRSILINELYIGTMVYNKTTQRLKSPTRDNPPGEWIRAENAFPAIIERKMFETAQGIIIKAEEEHAIRYSDKDMLSRLMALFERYGTVRSPLIAHEESMVSTATYAHRFGTLTGAYQRLFSDIIATRRAEVVATLKTAIPELAEIGDFIVLRNYVSIRVEPVVPFPHGYEAAWSFTADARPEIDITLGVPLENGGTFGVLGYLFLPRLMLGGRQIHLISTVPEKLDLHAYTISEAMQTLIGWKTPHDRNHSAHE